MDGEGKVVSTGGAVRTGGRESSRKDYRQAFVEAYEKYYARVFGYVYSRVSNVELSKDLVAEVFEKAYVKGHGLREPGAYATWLFMIARNVVIGHFRRQKREINGIDKVKESLWLSQSASDPEGEALRSEEVITLMKHLRVLSERDQELLSLKFEGELSYAEISTVLKMSEVNVRVSIFRALKRLRRLIERDAQ